MLPRAKANHRSTAIHPVPKAYRSARQLFRLPE